MTFKKRVNGSWTNIPHYIHKTSTDTIATLPGVLYSNDTTATVGLKGQTVQSGTPTPQNPVMPEGCGERTGNLFDIEEQIVNNQVVTLLDFGEDKNYPLISLVFEFSNAIAKEKNAAFIDLLEDNGTHHYITLKALRLSSTGGTDSFPLNEIVNDTYYASFTNLSFRYVKMYLYTSSYCSFSQGDIKTAIYNTNRTDYEPFGVKIPISSASTTTPVYLGEVETTRKIKKLVLTGEENWVLEYTDNFLLNASINDAEPTKLVVCTHQQSISIGYESDTNFENVRISQTKKLNFRTRTIPHNLSDFKSYLAAQYTAGTPVTVWYVLATPETAVVNEPLMKIGNYADEVSNISIPVTAGGDTISVGTTLQPSEVTVNYKGWHPVADVHERDNGAWT